MLFSIIFNLFFSTCVKLDHFWATLEIITFFVYFTMLSPLILFEGVKDSLGNGSRIFVSSIGRYGKLNQQVA